MAANAARLKANFASELKALREHMKWLPSHPQAISVLTKDLYVPLYRAKCFYSDLYRPIPTTAASTTPFVSPHTNSAVLGIDLGLYADEPTAALVSSQGQSLWHV